MEICESDVTKRSIINENKAKHASLLEHINQELPDHGGGNEYCVKITRIYLFSLIFSIVLHATDVGTDVYLAYQYFRYDEIAYFLLTVSFVVFPAFITTMLSIKMYAIDSEAVSSNKKIVRLFGSMLQFAPIVRYLEALQYALKLKNEVDPNSTEYKKYSRLLLTEDSNLALLRIIEGFLEAAPQQLLQITLLLRLTHNNHDYLLQTYQYMSVCSSIVSIAWSFAVYNRSIRFARTDKRKLSWYGSIIQVSWFFFVTSSRILAISEAASVYPFLTFVACVGHWLLMTTWISMFDRTWFCRQTNGKIDNSMEFIFCAIIGLVYIFAFLPTKDGETRYKYCFYYIIYFLENNSALIFWITWGNPELKKYWWFFPLVLFTFCSFLVGIMLMLIYYWYFHPERGIMLQSRRPQEHEMQNSPETNYSIPSSTKMVQTSELRKQ